MTLTATQNLENDHIHVLLLTEVMQKMVEKKSENMEHLELVVNLVRHFADGLHQAKEGYQHIRPQTQSQQSTTWQSFI